MADISITVANYSQISPAPSDGDVLLLRGGSFTIDVNTAKLGVGGVGNKAIKYGAGGQQNAVSVSDGVTLNLNCGAALLDDWGSGKTCSWTFGAGSKIKMWGTDANAIVTQENAAGNTGVFSFNGTVGSPVEIDGNGYLSVGAGYLDGYRGGVVKFINVPNVYLGNSGADIDYMEFDEDSGPLRINGGDGYYLKTTDPLYIGKLVHKKATSVNMYCGGVTAPDSTESRLIENMTLTGSISAGDMDPITFRYAYCYAVDHPGSGYSGRWENSWINLRPGYVYRYSSIKDCIAFSHTNDTHWFGVEKGGVYADGIIFGCFEPIINDSGNPLMCPSSSVTGNAVILRNCICLASWTEFVALFAYDGLSVTVNNCTVIRQAADYDTHAIALGDASMVYADTLTALNNIVVGSNMIGPYSDVNVEDDAVVLADYNCVTDPDAPYGPPAFVTRAYQSSPGANDQNVDPKFRNPDASLLTYSVSIGCSPEETQANKIAYITDSIVAGDIVPDDVIEYIKGGLTPTIAMPGIGGSYPGYKGAVEFEIPVLSTASCLNQTTMMHQHQGFCP